MTLGTASSLPARNGHSLDFAPVVLVADDEPVILELFRTILEEEPVRVLTAADGREALALAEAWIPELLVTDVMMAGLDGFGLIRALRRLYPGVPVIVMTASDRYDDRPVEEVAAEHGVVAILAKPFDLERLQQAIRAAVPFRGPVPPGTVDGSQAA